MPTTAEADAVLTPEQLRSVWDEEAAKIDAPAAAVPAAEVAVVEPPAAEVVPTAAADAQPAPVAKARKDPYAKLPEAVRTKLESVDKLAERVRSMEGNIGGLSEGHKHLKDLLSASQAAAAQVKDAPTQAAVKAATESPEKWQSLKNDFPDWSEAVEAFVESRIAGVQPQGVDYAAVDKLVDARLSQITPSLRKELSEEILDSEFEGWKDLVKTQKFVDWVGKQDDSTKALVNSDRLSDAAKLLRLYHTPVDPGKAITEARAKTLAAATSLPKGAHVPRAKGPEDMTPAELWAYEAEQRARQRAAY